MNEAGVSITWKMLDKNGIEKMITMRGETPADAPTVLKTIDDFTTQAIEYGWKPIVSGNAQKQASNAPQPVAQPAQPKPANSGQASGDCTFTATTLTIEFSPKGEKTGKLKGGRFEKFGVRLWPEVAQALGFDFAQYEAGDYRIEPMAVRYVEHDGKPSKVIGRAG